MALHDNAELAARGHLFSSTIESAASGALGDSNNIVQSFLFATSGSGGFQGTSIGSHSTANMAQNISNGSNGNIKPNNTSAAVADEDNNESSGQDPDQATSANATAPIEQVAISQRRSQVDLDPQVEEDFRKLKHLIQDLEEVEADTDSFSIPSNNRSDYLALFGRVVETILILLAVQHSINLTRVEANMFVAPLLFLLVFFNSQIKYMINHWNRFIVLIRRRISSNERDELIERQKYERDVIAVQEARKERDSSSLYSVTTKEQSLGQDKYADHSVPAEIRKMYPSHSVYTLAQVRLASSEQIFTFMNNILYLANVYITFLFIKAVLDKINASFSDGIWILVKATVFIMIVVPVYVEFQIAGYRQETVSRSYRLIT